MPRGKHTDLTANSRALTVALGSAAIARGPVSRLAHSGSRGGAPIWAMREAYQPPEDEMGKHGARKFRECTCPDSQCKKHGFDRTGRERAHAAARERGAWGRQQWEDNPTAEPDGFAVFGRFPRGWLDHVLKLRLLGNVQRGDILHVCSGTLSEHERWTVDIRPQARPTVVANGRSLPFRDGSFRGVILDPPYSDQYARNLYGVDNPRPSHLLREAARVVRPGGRIGMLHVAIPFSPPGCHLVNVWGVTTGVGFRIRAFTVYERDQEGLFAQ